MGRFASPALIVTVLQADDLGFGLACSTLGPIVATVDAKQDTAPRTTGVIVYIVMVTVSIGDAVIPRGADAEDVLRAAGRGFFKAKQRGELRILRL
jgi:hypothetical protein